MVHTAHRLVRFVVIKVGKGVMVQRQQQCDTQVDDVKRAHMNGQALQSAIRVRAPLVRQPDGYTCGVAALQSVLHYYGVTVRFDTLAAALGADPEQGTNYRRIAAYAETCGIGVTVFTDMTLETLYAAVNDGVPVIVALQAWGDGPTNAYINAWDDGHYAVVVGYDQSSVYFMDPSTLGNYTYIPTQEFLARWHDCYVEAGETIRLHRLGMAFRGEKVCFLPDQVTRMC